MRRPILLPILLLLLLLGLGLTFLAGEAQAAQEAICSETWVIVCDNFEDRATGGLDLNRATTKNPGWQHGFQPPGTQTGQWYVDAGTGVSGSKSMRVDCGPHGPGQPVWSGDPANGCGSFMAMYHSAASTVRTLYFRWYTRWATSSQDWIPSPEAEKHIITQYSSTIDGKTQGVHVAVSGSGQPQPVRVGISHVDIVYEPNTGPQFVRQDNTWYCFEARITLGSAPFVADGHVEMWIDGVQRHSRPNIATTAFPSMNWVNSQTLFSAYYNCIDDLACQHAADTHGTMSRFTDNWVVATQRIGCLGTTPPPAATDVDGDGFLDDGSDACPTQPGVAPDGCPVIPPPPPSQDPISEWNFEETTGTSVADTSARNPLTLVNGPTHVAGIIGSKAVQFDGVNDYAFNGAATGLPNSEAVKSFCTWFNYPVVGDDRQLFELSQAATNAFHLLSFNTYLASGVMSFGVLGGAQPSGGHAWFVRTETLPSANADHEVCYTWDSVTHKLYVDGALVASQVGPTPLAGPTQEVTIAGYPFGAVVGRAFNVKVDRTRVWNRALTASEIAVSFNALSPPATSVIRIDRVGSDGAITTAPAPAASSAIDGGVLSQDNPLDVLNLAAGTYVAQVLDIPDYSVTYGMCSYDVGDTACTVSSWPTTATSDGTRWSSSTITTFAGEVTRISFKYTLEAPNGVPSGIAAAQVTDTTNVQITWTDNASNETTQRIQRNAGGAGYADLTTVGANVVSYTDTTTSAGTQYCYKVRAENATGNTAYGTESCVTPGAVTDTPAPTVSGVSVSAIPLDVATATVLTGTNFLTGLTTLLIENDECKATNVIVTAATTITFTVICPSSATTGQLDLTATNPDGDSATLNNAFTVSGGYNLRTRKLTWRWEEAATPSPDSFTINWGTGTGNYTKKHPPVPYSAGVDIGIQLKYSVPLLEIFGTSGTYYYVIVPNYSGRPGTASSEQTIIVTDVVPAGVVTDIEIE